MHTSGKLKFLAVDDHADSAELVARVATRCGYDAIAVSDARAVLDMVRRHRPALLATDLCMPEMDAIEMFRLLKAAGFDGEIVLISGQPAEIRRSAAKLASLHGLAVVGNLQKPVDLAALRALMEKLQAA